MFSVVPVFEDLLNYNNSYPLMRSSYHDTIKNQLGFANEVKTIEDSHNQLTLGVNCDSFKPEEIKVKIQDNFLVIEADHEEKGEHNYSKRQFYRRFMLPDNAEQSKMKCSLTPSGILKVHIPKVPKQNTNKESVNIPIQFAK